MNKNKNVENFLKHVSEKESTWLEEAKWREVNEYWLEDGFSICVSILRYLRENNDHLSNLETKCGFKIDLHGKHDWKLSEIKKIELVTGLKLL